MQYPGGILSREVSLKLPLSGKITDCAMEESVWRWIEKDKIYKGREREDD